MVIQNTCPNLSNIVHTDFELGRVIQTVVGVDPGITVRLNIIRVGTTLLSIHEFLRIGILSFVTLLGHQTIMR